MKSISLNLNFAGAVLPVIDSEDGLQRVPLKPITDAIGLSWTDQHKKMQAPYFVRRLGICIGDIPHAGQTRQMVLIRLDRVAAYLNTLNPESVRAAGNEAAADFLEQKHREWDDLIHAYEQHRGELFSERSVKTAMAIARIDGMRDLTLKRIALSHLGIDPELGGTPSPTGNLFAA